MRILKGERILSASHDGSVKMWDIRSDSCVATVGKSPSPILCMDYDDSTEILAAAGVDGYVSCALRSWKVSSIFSVECYRLGMHGRSL